MIGAVRSSPARVGGARSAAEGCQPHDPRHPSTTGYAGGPPPLAAEDCRGDDLPSQRGRGRRAPMAEINVTPLVDVMLVLLIIFMVTAPLLTAGVPVNLPDSHAKPLDQDQKPIEISVQTDGTIFIDKDQVSDDDAARAIGRDRRAIGHRKPAASVPARRSRTRLRPRDERDGRAQQRRAEPRRAGKRAGQEVRDCLSTGAVALTARTRPPIQDTLEGGRAGERAGAAECALPRILKQSSSQAHA